MTLDISTGQAFLIGLVAGLSLISWIYTFFYFGRAMIVAALVGAILKKGEEGLIFGAAAELIYLGMINAAGVVPPNYLGPGIFGTILYLEQGNIGVAIALSMPFAIFIQFLVTLIFTINSPLGKLGERLVKEEKFVLYRISGHATGILLFITGFAVGLIGGLGHEAFKTAVDKIPGWLQTGLGKGGGMLPALGFAVVLRLMLKKEYMPFMLVGYTLLVIFQGVFAAKPEWGGFNLVVVTIAAFAIAMVTFNSGVLQKTQRRNVAVEGASDGI